MLDLRLFENRTFAFSVTASMLYFCAAFSVVFTVPLAAQVALRLSPFRAGLLLLPISALNIVMAPVAGALSDRIPARYISTAGALVFALGALGMTFLPEHPALWNIAAVLVVAGAGAAVFTQPNNSTIMGSAPANRRGIASGILATARATGQVVGIALAGAIYFMRAHQLGALSNTFVPAKAVFAVVAVLMFFVSVLSYTRD
jgi:MFS family permease